MNTAHATNIIPGTLILVDGKAFKVFRIVNTTNHVIFTNRKGETVTVNKLEEIELVTLGDI